MLAILFCSLPLPPHLPQMLFSLHTTIDRLSSCSPSHSPMSSKRPFSSTVWVYKVFYVLFSYICIFQMSALRLVLEFMYHLLLFCMNKEFLFYFIIRLLLWNSKYVGVRNVGEEEVNLIIAGEENLSIKAL